MRIGIIGAGNIGSTTALRLSSAGHDVSIANSRAPETIAASTLETGARPRWAAEVTDSADVVIVSVNMGQVPAIADLVRAAPSSAVVIDTSNYYPARDGHIDALDEHDAVESLWVAGHYGRPVAKAWNAITAASYADRSSERGAVGRIAIPVAADSSTLRDVAMTLVEDTGFDAVHTGPIGDSWRHQPGTPAYCTDLTRDELEAALAIADRGRSARRRDLVMDVVSERVQADGGIGGDRLVALNRAVY